METPEDLVRSYYRSLDDHDYETLRSILAPSFVHERPDRTLDGRERFVQFMRDERPQTDTTHPIDAIYRDGDGEIAVRGRLLDADGDQIASFVDVFQIADRRLESLRTYTD